MTNGSRPEDFADVEKVELHQHVDGSMPASFTWELMLANGLAPVKTFEEMQRLLVLQEDEEGSLLDYLDKFHYPLWVTQFYQNIADATFHIAQEAWNNGVRGLELRYAPNIHTYAGLTLRQAITSVLSGMNRAERELQGMRCGLIVIAMRHFGPHIAKILARQSISEAQQFHDRVGVVGFDIAGAERGNPPVLFREAFDIARKGRLGLTLHAGEDGAASYVWQAIDDIGATRIGHGCAALQDRELMRRLARDQVVVECCISSNFQTGAAKRGEPHPIVAFLDAGVPVAICTDNTTVSNTCQQRECQLAAEMIGSDAVRQILATTPSYSFIRGLRIPTRRGRRR